LTNFASIAKTGATLYCIVEKYEYHPDFIETITTVIPEPAPKVKTFKDFLNDILYSKLV